jgi:uncharacterized membrane protein YraQ (UPF0718 family)
MNLTFWIMAFLAGLLILMAYVKNPSLPMEGLKAGGKLFWDILPAMILAFIAAGMITKVLPREFLTQWMGEGSGFRGLVVASVAGSLTPGGPFIQFPIVAALLKSGAGIAPLMTYVSAWALLSVNRFLVFEMPVLGLKLSVVRMAASLVFPIMIGLLTRVIWIRF